MTIEERNGNCRLMADLGHSVGRHDLKVGSPSGARCGVGNERICLDNPNQEVDFGDSTDAESQAHFKGWPARFRAQNFGPSAKHVRCVRQ
jgi:hypothetical protein